MHGKDAVIAAPLNRCVGIQLVHAKGVDTDALGTFTGDIPRAGSMVAAARAKAELALAATGLTVAVSSEGSFGPHPALPFVAAGHELLLWLDTARDIEIVVNRLTKTNYWTGQFSAGHLPDDAQLRAVGFPTHALIVRPNVDSPISSTIRKGIRERAMLEAAVAEAASASPDGSVIVQTDMRAHMNPTRLASIGKLARRLAVRLARLCPSCGAPGFGAVEVIPGLPCAECSAPTRLARAERFACSACRFSEVRRERSPTQRADAMWCDLCNP
jgi:hypothetical protein